MGNQENKAQDILRKKDFDEIQQAGDFKIVPCETKKDIESDNQYKKMELDITQKMQLNALLQHVPSAIAAGQLANAYTITFPKGLPHTLMKLKTGGFATPVIGTEGNILGMASLYPVLAEAALLGTFTALSVVTGQFFLSRINKELTKINQKLDQIVEFLYGEKKAELMSEVSFTKYAYENYASIMLHEEQRVATIFSLQQAEKVAVKDIEFYLNDLDRKVGSKEKICERSRDALQMKECLDLSIQLYVLSRLLEMWYAQNQEQKYVKFLQETMLEYIEKIEKHILKRFTALQTAISDIKKPDDKEKDLINQINEIVEAPDGKSPMRQSLEAALNTAVEMTEYYYCSNSNSLYAKI